MNNDVLFQKIIDILNKDSILCNYIRYIDYGEIKRPNNRSDVYMWTSSDCVLNYNNSTNNTQCVRFVPKIDARFLEILRSYNDYLIQNVYENRYFDPIRLFWNQIIQDKNSNDINNCINEIHGKLLNIDCSVEVKGSSLTALDFVGKNVRFSGDEAVWFRRNIFENNKLLFIGDKCHILAILDKYYNIWVSTKTLYNIYNIVDENKFNEIILKIFNFVNRYTISNLKCSISQFISNEITNVVVKKIYQNKEQLNSVDVEFKPLHLYDFSDNENCNEYIHQNINNLIKQSVEDVIKDKFSIDMNFIDYLESISNMYNRTLIQNTRKAYINGMTVSSVIKDIGWNIVYNTNEHTSVNLNSTHYYIYKDVNITPTVAFINDSYSRDYDISTCRKLKQNFDLSLLKNFAYITRLYIDMTDGSMLAIGPHPNVSGGGQVCMGDLRGKIVFGNTSREELIRMINDCEKLLCTINYTSSYYSQGQQYFFDRNTSEDYSVQIEDSTITSEIINSQKDLIKDVSSIDDSDFEITEDSEENNSPSEFESEDFEPLMN